MAILRSRFCVFAIIIASVFAISSCDRRKQQPNINFSQALTDTIPLDSAYRLIGHTYQEWADVQMPVTATLIDADGKGQSLSGRLSMVRDSAIEISLRAMGVEAALAYFDDDTVVVADKYHKQFLAEPYCSVFGASGLSLGNLQDALLGTPFIAADMAGAWKAQIEGGILQALIFEDDDAKVIGIYGNNDLDVLAQIADKQARLALKFNFDQAKWDTGRKIRLRSPKGGTRIYGVDIMQSIYSGQQ